MVKFTSALALAAAVAASCIPAVAQAHCYSIYNGKDELVFQSTQSPVDLRQPLADAVKKRFTADSRMVFTPNTDDCPVVDKTVAPVSIPEASKKP
ncbi:hypothetical protein G7047_05040 [Diaphorobacter sp. HDW4A]|uniref:hypothetical protein n=1 Tax=Diaphorobacter sp. HDW4A TaxID=2714924 RepID=UPI0014080C1E|nr:hypothetical protein [Diaphorobacter sp. HDW4A]QIL79342.1 hypothetical protein G7047_05040 [Diaphorobacter sp. HDW4A]